MKVSTIKSLTINYLNKILKKISYKLVPEENFRTYNNYYTNFTRQISNNEGSNDIISIVFSKDRAMQLHAFLCSYIEQVANYSTMTVLYKASNERHEKSYAQLQRIFKNNPYIKFIKETSFRSQLIEILESNQTNKVLLYVDDMIFTHPFDYSLLKDINPYTHILSLSRGKDLDYSIVLQQKLNLPNFFQYNQSLIEFKWNEIKEFSDWSYPLGVSGYMFSAKEFLAMCQSLNFKAPNSLESSMQQLLPFFNNRLGLCGNNIVAVCVHANITQTEGYNPVLGTYSIDDLLDKWEKGYRIDCTQFYNLPAQIAQEKTYTFLQEDKHK